MKIVDSLNKRRSYYNIGKDIDVTEDKLVETIKEITNLVPHPFNNQSSRLIIVTKEKQDELWDNIYDVFEGKVPREKIDSFKSGYGTILYFIDQEDVDRLKGEFPSYAENFDGWANQSMGMLQLSIWTGLRELNIGASLQHYNPVIDSMVKEMFNVDDKWILNAQMPFGNILEEPEAIEKVDINKLVKKM